MFYACWVAVTVRVCWLGWYQRTSHLLDKLIPRHDVWSRSHPNFRLHTKQAVQGDTQMKQSLWFYYIQVKNVSFLRILAKISKKIKAFTQHQPLSTDQSRLFKCNLEGIPHKDCNVRLQHWQLQSTAPEVLGRERNLASCTRVNVVMQVYLFPQ